jgi:type II secretory pathway component PulF
MKTTDDLLGDLYDATVNALLGKIKSGEATAADLAVARAMLRDQGIAPAKGTHAATEQLKKQTLPFPTHSDENTLQ